MKRAIALSGGGTKGSYEVGVWKALLEKDIDYQIVTGTSIGSINGAFMVTKQYDEAYFPMLVLNNTEGKQKYLTWLLKKILASGILK